MERRARKLTTEYEAVLRGYDVRFHGAAPMVRGQPEPVPGPLVARFRDFGGLCEGQLVAGPWGELSPNFHQLLKVCAESRVAAMGRAQGWEAGPNMLGKVMGEVRRAMSVTVVRAQALCLLSRITFLREGARAAAGRRQQATWEEEERRRVQLAHYWAHVRRRGVPRAGEVYTLP